MRASPTLVSGRQLVDLGHVVPAVGAEQRQQGRFGQVRVGLGQERSDGLGIAGQLIDRGLLAFLSLATVASL